MSLYEGDDVKIHGSLGIGVASPTAKLQIATGNIRLTDDYYLEWGGTKARIGGSNSGDYVFISTDNTDRFRVHSDGDIDIAQRLGIGGAHNNSYQLYVTGVGLITSNLRLGGPSSSAAGNANDPAITVGGYTNAGVYFESSGVGLGAGTGKYLFLDSTGKVSIGGTTSNNRKLFATGSLASAYLAEFTNTHATQGYGVLIKAGDDNNVTALSVNDKDGNEKLRVRAGGQITFANAYTFPTSIGSAGQVLKVPSSGTTLEWDTLDWEDLPNISSLTALP